MKSSVGRLVSILYRKNQVYLNVVLKPLNITAAEVPVLIHLFGRDGISQEELSSFLVIDKAATARVVQSLIEKGFLRKEKDPDDRRANQIFLTGQAIAQRETIFSHLQQWTDFLTAGLDETSVQTMFAVLEAMADKVEGTDFRTWGQQG
ncbi:MAG: MarR family winged helix-turn-helix transcriptional regulator [Eubacteriales bacterium]|nr:MarR family winged helix-turn-helix transcriptional regulator [Eubacteriales bacterium]